MKNIPLVIVAVLVSFNSYGQSKSLALKYQRINLVQTHQFIFDEDVVTTFDLNGIPSQIGLEYSKINKNNIVHSFQISVPTFKKSFNTIVDPNSPNFASVPISNARFVNQNFYYTASKFWQKNIIEYGLGIGINPSYSYLHLAPFRTNEFPVYNHNFKVSTYVKPQIKVNFKTKYFLMIETLVDMLEFDSNIVQLDNPSFRREDQRFNNMEVKFSKYRMQFGLGIGCEI